MIRSGAATDGDEVRIAAGPPKAIAVALDSANSGDMVLIAGKGHEKTQTTRAGVFPFDDFEVAREELHKLGYSKSKQEVSR